MLKNFLESTITERKLHRRGPTERKKGSETIIDTNPIAYDITNIISEKAYEAGYNGIIYPSAQVEGQTNVVLFRDRYKPDNFKQVFDQLIK